MSQQAPGTWKKEAGVDCRTQTATGLLRSAFLAAGPEGAGPEAKRRGAARKTYNFCVLCLSEMLSEFQAGEMASEAQRLLAAVMERASLRSVAKCSVNFYATQLQMYLPSQAMVDVYSRGQRHARGPCTVAVMAQNHGFLIPPGPGYGGFEARLFVPPLVVEAETASGVAASLLVEERANALHAIASFAAAVRYLLVGLERDTAAYNGRAGRKCSLKKWGK